jgi:hypothetical protein
MRRAQLARRAHVIAWLAESVLDSHGGDGAVSLSDVPRGGVTSLVKNDAVKSVAPTVLAGLAWEEAPLVTGVAPWFGVGLLPGPFAGTESADLGCLLYP